MRRRPPRSTRTDTRVPYTTPFRSPPVACPAACRGRTQSLGHVPDDQRRRRVRGGEGAAAAGDRAREGVRRPPAGGDHGGCHAGGAAPSAAASAFAAALRLPLARHQPPGAVSLPTHPRQSTPPPALRRAVPAGASLTPHHPAPPARHRGTAPTP